MNTDAEIIMPEGTDIEGLKNMDPVTRTNTILNIKVVEKLAPEEEGLELNEGYEYEINGTIPQLADGIAKMAIEMDKQPDLGDKAGGAFLALVEQYYLKLNSQE